jgi:hypothetical protein
MGNLPVLDRSTCIWLEIAGLDPAGLHFERYDNKVKLDPSDASFVDVIHTDAASLVYFNMSLGSRISVRLDKLLKQIHQKTNLHYW